MHLTQAVKDDFLIINTDLNYCKIKYQQKSDAFDASPEEQQFLFHFFDLFAHLASAERRSRIKLRFVP